MEPERIPKSLTEYTYSGAGSTGRPRLRWKEGTAAGADDDSNAVRIDWLVSRQSLSIMQW
jgi:hypothetical protein